MVEWDCDRVTTKARPLLELNSVLTLSPRPSLPPRTTKSKILSTSFLIVRRRNMNVRGRSRALNKMDRQVQSDITRTNEQLQSAPHKFIYTVIVVSGRYVARYTTNIVTNVLFTRRWPTILQL